jgi:hypothetical protein
MPPKTQNQESRPNITPTAVIPTKMKRTKTSKSKAKAAVDHSFNNEQLPKLAKKTRGKPK